MIPSKATLQLPILAFAGALLTSFTLAPTGRDALGTDSPMRVTQHVAGGLEYLMVEPPDVPPGAELPMVVHLHGRGDVPAVLQGPIFDIDTPVRVILPRAPDRFGTGYAWMPVSAHRGQSPPLVDAIERRSRLLAEAMITWRRRHPTRGRPIVTGFSQGGMLAMAMAVHHPESIAQALPVAGWLPPSLEPRTFDPYASHAPVVAVHGTDDEILSATRTQAVVRRLSALGYPIRFEQIDGAGHEMHPDMRALLRELLERALDELPASGRAGGLS